MIEKSKFSWRKRGKAFSYAWQGLKALLIYEHNARLHLVAAVCIIVAGFLLNVSAIEWCVLVLTICGVFVAEALNTAVEVLADKITLEKDPLIGRAKDLGATAVTISAFSAVIIGFIIFLPKLINLFN